MHKAGRLHPFPASCTVNNLKVHQKAQGKSKDHQTTRKKQGSKSLNLGAGQKSLSKKECKLGFKIPETFALGKQLLRNGKREESHNIHS